MAIRYKIKAQIVDIKSDSPRSEDVFFVDTNVWYWLTYSKATSYKLSQLSEYPIYLNKALSTKSRIHHSGLSLAELAHLIERTEREIYEKKVCLIKPKEYRHNLAGERSRVFLEIQTAWGQVIDLADPLAITIDELATTEALNRFQSEKVDGYDLFILESMRNHGVAQIITDDGDFAAVCDIQVFTANRNVIKAARNQSMLLAR